jgi:hypothetical protein
MLLVFFLEGFLLEAVAEVLPEDMVFLRGRTLVLVRKQGSS